jgi:metal-dependent hydrolase (beta-lactamase superfamily II)
MRRVRLTAEPLRLADRVLFPGEIGDRLPFGGPAPGAVTFEDDTALALGTEGGLVILSGALVPGSARPRHGSATHGR